MKQFSYIIKDPEGMHARPAGLLSKFAQQCSSNVSISACGRTADAKRLFNVMGLGAKQNDKMSFTVEGPNEKSDSEKLEEFCKKNI